MSVSQHQTHEELERLQKQMEVVLHFKNGGRIQIATKDRSDWIKCSHPVLNWQNCDYPTWNWRDCDYRKAPELVERWAIEINGIFLNTFATKELAERWLKNSLICGKHRVFPMREVTDEFK